MSNGNLEATVYPNPANDIIAIQAGLITTEDLNVALYDMTGRLIQSTKIYQGSTIAYIDARTLYNGEYLVRVFNNSESVTKKITIAK